MRISFRHDLPVPIPAMALPTSEGSGRWTMSVRATTRPSRDFGPGATSVYTPVENNLAEVEKSQGCGPSWASMMIKSIVDTWSRQIKPERAAEIPLSSLGSVGATMTLQVSQVRLKPSNHGLPLHDTNRRIRQLREPILYPRLGIVEVERFTKRAVLLLLISSTKER
jgi:hypothetical protein